MPWVDPSLTLRWGPYLKLDAQDELQRVQMVTTAKTAGVITKRQAVEKLAPVFGTQDVSAVLESLEKEADEEMKAAQAAMQETDGAGTKQAGPQASGSAQRAPKNPADD